MLARFQTADVGVLEIEVGDTRIRLERAGVSARIVQTLPGAPAEPAPAQLPAQSPPPAPASSAQRVISPIVGTFYAAASPDAPPFVKIGQRVKKGDTLCIVEAMKTMNEIECEYDGVVMNILSQNGDLVEFGQPLFEIGVE